MKAKEFVKSKYPKAFAFSMIDNLRGRNSYVILKALGNLEIFNNEGATTESKAWTNAKKQIIAEQLTEEINEDTARYAAHLTNL